MRALSDTATLTKRKTKNGPLDSVSAGCPEIVRDKDDKNRVERVTRGSNFEEFVQPKGHSEKKNWVRGGRLRFNV